MHSVMLIRIRNEHSVTLDSRTGPTDYSRLHHFIVFKLRNNNNYSVRSVWEFTKAAVCFDRSAAHIVSLNSLNSIISDKAKIIPYVCRSRCFKLKIPDSGIS